MAKITMIKAVTDALDEELARDEKVLVFGEDVGNNGGVFRATEGLQAKYGDKRVFDTPLAESGIIGLANGLATQGWRPVPEINSWASSWKPLTKLLVKWLVNASVTQVLVSLRSPSVHHLVVVFTPSNCTPTT